MVTRYNTKLIAKCFAVYFNLHSGDKRGFKLKRNTNLTFIIFIITINECFFYLEIIFGQP